jgi:hypothetical protein
LDVAPAGNVFTLWEFVVGMIFLLEMVRGTLVSVNGYLAKVTRPVDRLGRVQKLAVMLGSRRGGLFHWGNELKDGNMSKKSFKNIGREKAERRKPRLTKNRFRR